MAFQKRRPDPTLSARHFYGSEVLRHREERGWSLARLAVEALSSAATLSRVESGDHRVPEGLSEQLDRVFETGGHFMRLLPLARREDHPAKYQEILSLIDQATMVECYSPSVDGLLQTEDYARHVLRAGMPYAVDDEIQNRVRARLGRQLRLQAADCRYWFILDESALRRAVGGREVMARQLQAILDVAQLTNVVVQVLPFEAGAHSEYSSLFLLTMDDGQRVAYEESSRAGVVFDKSRDVVDRQALYDLLRAQALSPQASELLIRSILEGLTSDAPRRPSVICDGTPLAQEQLQQWRWRSLHRG
ncbi:helix-turn-helix transcriptional regulator [Kitasatospora saccharophila]|uniref:Helix-turn-helix transcriptional regulator n=1 Tax=Kitasatospora saccharophila TaxID=407973 RepID=A0ABN2Y778_9ACTN